ncbi:MAG: hypothetical protein P3B98_07095 [Gemmatimonadota bacterium]|nr:hypothetical protein [Gemmatimonadota bacterium]
MSHSAHSGSDPVIAGTVLPLQRAEELIATLPSVVSVRIVSTESGGVDTIHVLTTGETPPKQMVRNVESALMAHLGMRVDHRKVSVATTTARPTPGGGVSAAVVQAAVQAADAAAQPEAAQPAASQGAASGESPRRTMYFEDIELRGSRAKGVTCRVTLRRGDETFVGEAEGFETDRNRMDVAARATIEALVNSYGSERRRPTLEGTKLVEAFDREFVFVGVMVRLGREIALTTGSAEVKESVETAAVLAVLDATNRWVAGRTT